MTKKVKIPKINFEVSFDGPKEGLEIWDILIKNGYLPGARKHWSVGLDFIQVNDKSYLNWTSGSYEWYRDRGNSFTAKQAKAFFKPKKPKKPKKYTGTIWFECPSDELARAFHTLARSKGIDYVPGYEKEVFLSAGYAINVQDKRMFHSACKDKEGARAWGHFYKKLSIEQMFSYLSSLETGVLFKSQYLTKDEIQMLAKKVGLLP